MRRVPPLLPLLLAACSVAPIPQHRPVARPPADPATLFQCLRENRLAIVAAQHGRARAGDPENAISSFYAAMKTGPLVIAVDVARSADGVLMLIADDKLDRTTTGSGRLAAHRYQDLRRFHLKAPDGTQLEERIPTLDEALTWARRNSAILRLDARPDVPLAELLDHVRRHRMERQVILVARGLAAGRAALRAAPEVMVEASGRSAAETAQLLKQAGPRLLLSTGFREPTPAQVASFDKAGVAAAMVSAGAPETALLADGRGASVGALAARGVTLFTSDRAAEMWDALEDTNREGRPCLEGEET
jgi:glycerophosphoryl diester phosphodiesterase